MTHHYYCLFSVYLYTPSFASCSVVTHIYTNRLEIWDSPQKKNGGDKRQHFSAIFDNSEKKQNNVRGATPKLLGGPNPSLHHLSPSLPFTFPFPPLTSFHSLPLEVGRLSTAGLGSALSSTTASQRLGGRAAQRIWCILP